MIGKGVVSSESRRHWEKLQNRRPAKLLTAEEAARLLVRDLPPTLQRRRTPYRKAPSKLLGKRRLESVDDCEEEEDAQRMRVHLDLLREYEDRKNKKTLKKQQQQETLLKVMQEVRSFFDPAQEYDDKNKVQKLPAVKLETAENYCHSAFNLQVGNAVKLEKLETVKEEVIGYLDSH